MSDLTKFEEQILLSVWKLQDEAYGISIYNHIRNITNKDQAIGGIYFPLERLVKKGLLERRQDPDNRRCVLITVAQQAQNFIETVDEELIEEIGKLADKMGSDNFKKWHEVIKAVDTAIEMINETKQVK